MSEPQTWDEAVDAILGEFREIMHDRQRKYGPENVRQQGLYGVLTRAFSDKVPRIQRALNGYVEAGKVILNPIEDETDETFDDGCIDLANYMLIALMVKRGWWELPRA